MQCVDIECPQSMLLIRRQKYDCRHAFSRQCTQNLKTVHAWHLDVEEHNIGGSFQDSLNRGYPVSAFSNDLHILESTQPMNDASPRQRLVVDD
jgi:hypothetical protein